MFGFVECDIEVPDHLKEYFLEMTPMLKNVDVCLDDVGEFMQNYVKQHNVKDVPRRLLIGPYFGKKSDFDTIIRMVFRTRTCHHTYLHCC